MSVMSDDGITIPVEPEPAPEPTKVFTEEDLIRARQQEKDKMYKKVEDTQSKMKALEEQLSLIAQEKELARQEAEERAAREAELIRKREEDELTAKELLFKREEEFNNRINQVQSEWESKFKQLEEEKEYQQLLLEKERQFQALEAYRQRRINEEQESIMPELLDFIAGDSEEAIEDSIATLRAKTNDIMESIQKSAPQSRLKGAPVTAPPVGPLDNQMDTQTYSLEDLRNMPMEKFAQMRDRLLKARPTDRGRY